MQGHWFDLISKINMDKNKGQYMDTTEIRTGFRLPTGLPVPI